MRKKILRVLVIVILSFAGLLLVIGVLIYLPPVQRFIKNKALSSVSAGTGMEITVDGFRMRFPAVLQLDNVAIRQPGGDTLLTARTVGVRIALLPLIRSNVRANGLDIGQTYINYSDSAGTTLLRGTLESLTVPRAAVNLKNSEADISGLDIHGADVQLTIGEGSDDETPSDTARWVIALRAATLSDIRFEMYGTGGRLSAMLTNARIDNAHVSLPAQTVDAALVRLDTASYSYTPPPATTAGPSPETTAPPSTETAPGPGQPWTVNISRVELSDNHARYTQGDTLQTTTGFDAGNIEARNLNLTADSAYNRGDAVRLHLGNLSLTERSGLTITDANGSFSMDSTGVYINDFHITTTGSTINLDANGGNGILQSDPDAPLTAGLQATIDTDELMLFVPLENSLRRTLTGKTADIRLNAQGSLSRLNVSTMTADLPGIINVNAQGQLLSLDRPQRLGGDLRFSGTTGNLTPLETMIADTALRNRLTIPSGMSFYGNAVFSPGSYTPDITLTVADGTLHLAGTVNTNTENYDLDLRTVDFPLSRLLPRDSLGIATLSLDASGNGFNPLGTNANADIDLVIDRFDYNNYPYSDITLKAMLAGGVLSGNLHSGSQPLNLDLAINGTRADSAYTANVRGRIRNADLAALGLSQDSLAVAGMIDATLKYWPDTAYAATVILDTVRVNHGRRTESFAHAELRGRAGRNNITVDAISGDLTLAFMAGVPADSITARIRAAGDEFTQQLEARSLDMEAIQRVLPPLKLDIDAGPDNLLHSIALDNGYGFNHLTVSANTLRNEQFRAAVVARGFQTSGLTLDTLNVWMRRNDKRLDYAIRLRNRPGNIEQMALVRARGYAEDNRLHLDMLQRNRNDSIGFRFGVDATLLDSAVTVTLDPDNLVFGYRPWTVNTGNYFTYDFDKELYADMRLDGQGEHFHIVSAPMEGFTTGAVEVDMGGIDIATTLGLFPAPPPAGGTLSGDVRFGMNPQTTAVEGTIQVDSASWDGRRIGDIILTADVRSDSTATDLQGIRMQVDGKQVLTATGRTGPKETNIDATLTDLPLTAVNPFLPEETLQADGTARGELQLRSAQNGLDIDGRLAFNNAGITVPIAGTRFTLPSDYITFREGEMDFDNYRITSPGGQALNIDGTLDISDLNDPSADLSITATAFDIVNSQRSGGSDVYGRALTDIDITATGRLNALRVRGDISLLTGTDVTYTLPDNNLNVADRTQDIVTFISFSDTTAVFAADSAALLRVWGMDMLVNVDVQDNVKATINLSDDGNNRAELTGDGSLTYTMNTQGDSRFTGRYTLSGGTVVYNPPVISAKSFTVNDGSYVEWTGDIADPSFNVTATESLSTTVESDGSSRNVTFEITVRIQNTLSNLALVFDLGAPSDLAIQNQLQSLSPEERSQQAIALLIYNTYTGPGTTARVDANNPLNSFIEKELNQWARNSLPGVDLSLGINSVNDADGGQHTDYSYRVSKSLFDDRVQVTVGGSINPEASTNENLKDNFVDDITLEYRLSSRDNMFLKAYRYNTQESILEGEVTETGFGFVARKKLNRLKDLFRLRRSPEQKAVRRNRRELKQQVREHERATGVDPARTQRQDDPATLNNNEEEVSTDRQATPGRVSPADDATGNGQ